MNVKTQIMAPAAQHILKQRQKNEEPTEACGFHADCVPHSLSIVYSYKAQHPASVRVNEHHENVIKIGVHKMMPKP